MSIARGGLTTDPLASPFTMRSSSQRACSLLLLVALLLGVVAACGGGDGGDEDVFVATNEFVEVPAWQHLPPGLHVRMDMTTGKRYAKLLAPEDSDNKAVINVPASDKTDLLPVAQVTETPVEPMTCA